MQAVDFNELSQKIIQILEKQTAIILATSSNDKVTARVMSHVNEGLTIYFPAGDSSEKIQHIKINPNVACAVDNMQIEGIAKICGYYDENPHFIDLYKTKHPRYFEAYKIMGNELVIRVNAKRIKLWTYLDGIPCLNILDIENNMAYQEMQNYFNRHT